MPLLSYADANASPPIASQRSNCSAQWCRSALAGILLLVIASNAAMAGSSVKRASAEALLAPHITWLNDATTDGRQTDIRIGLATSPLLEAAAVWTKNGDLRFPDRTLAPHIYDKVIDDNESRLKTLIAKAEPSAWERYDSDVSLLMYCTKKQASPICILVNTEALASQLDTDKPALLKAIFEAHQSFSKAIIAVLGLGLMITLLWWRKSKPAGPAETTNPSEHLYTMGDMSIDSRRMTIQRDSLQSDISQRDLKLLTCLLEHPNEVINKDRLYTAGWSRDFVPSSRSLEQHIMTLRKKIDPERNRPGLIETVHGQGYRFPADKL